MNMTASSPATQAHQRGLRRSSPPGSSARGEPLRNTLMMRDYSGLRFPLKIMLLITEDQVRKHLPMKEAVRLMRETFTALRNGSAINQPRRRMTLPTGSVLHSMAGAIGKYFGTKFYSANPKSGAHFFFFLFDSETAKP